MYTYVLRGGQRSHPNYLSTKKLYQMTDVNIPYILGKSILKIETTENKYIITLDEGTTIEFQGRGCTDYLVGTNIEVVKDTKCIFSDSEWN